MSERLIRTDVLPPHEVFAPARLHWSRIIRCTIPCPSNIYHWGSQHNWKWRSLGCVCCRSLRRYPSELFFKKLTFSSPTGSAISWDGDFNTHTEEEVFASVIVLVLNCACFVYIGAWIPFNDFNANNITPWRLAILTVGIMVLKRIPAILALYKWIPEITSWREALFSGHFGEIFSTVVSMTALAN